MTQTVTDWPIVPGPGVDGFSQQQLIKVEATETLQGYQIRVSLACVDLRQLYILANPRGLLIEFRQRESVHHDGSMPIVDDIGIYRVSHELVFAKPIRRGGTTARVTGNSLVIECRKAEPSDAGPWSEWVTVDTRSGLGSVGKREMRF